MELNEIEQTQPEQFKKHSDFRFWVIQAVVAIVKEIIDLKKQKNETKSPNK